MYQSQQYDHQIFLRHTFTYLEAFILIGKYLDLNEILGTISPPALHGLL